MLPVPMRRAAWSSRLYCMQAVVSHALECTVIKKWNPDDALYVIFEEIKTSLKLSVVPPRLREQDMRVAILRKEEIVIDGAQPCKMTDTVACVLCILDK